MEKHLDQSLDYRGGRDQTKTSLKPFQRMKNKMRRELNYHGYMLLGKQVGRGKKRYRDYNVVMIDAVKKHLPHFEIDTEKLITSGKKIKLEDANDIELIDDSSRTK